MLLPLENADTTQSDSDWPKVCRQFINLIAYLEARGLNQVVGLSIALFQQHLIRVQHF